MAVNVNVSLSQACKIVILKPKTGSPVAEDEITDKVADVRCYGALPYSSSYIVMRTVVSKTSKTVTSYELAFWIQSRTGILGIGDMLCSL